MWRAGSRSEHRCFRPFRFAVPYELPVDGVRPLSGILDAITSFPGLAPAPQFTMTFWNAAKGFEILSAKDGKEALLAALHDEDLNISGDFVEVMWFQGFTEYLKPNP
jgi:hypothetical protein